MSLLCSIYSWTKRQPLNASSIFIWCLSSWYFHVNRSPRDLQFTAVIKLAISDCRLLDRFFSFRRCYALRLQFGFKFCLVCTGKREQQKWTKMLSVSLSSFSFSLCVRRAFWKRKTSFRVMESGCEATELLHRCMPTTAPGDMAVLHWTAACHEWWYVFSPPPNPTWAPHYTTLVTMNWRKNELFLCKWSSIWKNLHNASFKLNLDSNS
jgi:hypothetical protein